MEAEPRKTRRPSDNMSQADFRLMLQDLAEEAEHKLPGPSPKVEKLHQQEKQKTRKIRTIFIVCLVLFAAIVAWGIKNADDLPLGLGGILKAYTVGTKAPVPQPGEQLKPNQQPRPMDPEKWGQQR